MDFQGTENAPLTLDCHRATDSAHGKRRVDWTDIELREGKGICNPLR